MNCHFTVYSYKSSVTVSDEQVKTVEETLLDDNKRLRALVLNYEVSQLVSTKGCFKPVFHLANLFARTEKEAT